MSDCTGGLLVVFGGGDRFYSNLPYMAAELARFTSIVNKRELPNDSLLTLQSCYNFKSLLPKSRCGHTFKSTTRPYSLNYIATVSDDRGFPSLREKAGDRSPRVASQTEEFDIIPTMASEAKGRTIGNRISGVQIKPTPSLIPTKIAPAEAHFPELLNGPLWRDVFKDVRSQMGCISRSTITRARRFFCPFPFLSIKWWASVLCFMIVLLACASLYLRFRGPKIDNVSPSSASRPSNWTCDIPQRKTFQVLCAHFCDETDLLVLPMCIERLGQLNVGELQWVMAVDRRPVVPRE